MEQTEYLMPWDNASKDVNACDAWENSTFWMSWTCTSSQGWTPHHCLDCLKLKNLHNNGSSKEEINLTDLWISLSLFFQNDALNVRHFGIHRDFSRSGWKTFEYAHQLHSFTVDPCLYFLNTNQPLFFVSSFVNSTLSSSLEDNLVYNF
jgi:hypothetical protein